MKKISIIGAGLGGLVAGNLLARKGYKVTLFESHVLPGGYTAGFWRKGFYFESGTLAFESSPLVFKTLKDIGVYDKLSFEKHLYRFVGEGVDGMPSTYDEMKKMYLSAYPQQRAELERYFRDLDAMYHVIAAVMGEAPMWRKALALPGFLWLALKYKDVTSSDFVGRYFPKGSTLYRTFASHGYPDMPAIIIGGLYFSLFEDYWSVQDGFQKLADVLAENFKKLGGELRLHSRVEKILTRDGAAVGVRCKGEDIPADVVISASDYKKTFLTLLSPEDVPAQLREKIEKAQVSEGFTIAYLGLSISNDELRKIMKRQDLLVGDVTPGVNIQDSNDATYFERAAFSLHSLSLMNPKLAPEGKSSLMVEMGTPYRWMGNWGGGDKEKYQQLKAKVMETLINRIEAILPGVKNAIEVKDLATPLTFERYTANTDGATSAWSWNPKKKFYKNSMGTYVDTPVRNLYIGSCWASQIGGVPGAISAACACVKKIG